MKFVFALIVCLFISGCSRPAITESNTLENFSATEESLTETDLALEMQFSEIAKEAKGKVGVAAVEIETGRAAYLNQNERFAMQSIVKLPISMAVIKLAQERKLSLDQRISISGEEYVPSNMRSPLRDSNSSEITLQELIRYAVSESDGTASDVLQRLAGDAAGVQAFIDSLGITDMKVKYTHKEFAVQWDRQYENWSTPEGTLALLKALWAKNGCVQGRECKELLLLRLMTESNNPSNRLKGMLPADAVVAHKTGTGGTRNGVTSATNDVGIITMPNGNHVTIAVFVGDSSADEKTRAGVIAKIAKAVWDRWSK